MTTSEQPKHNWLQIYSHRTQPYTLEDISIIIPSSAGRYEKRWEWFWKQYVEKTHPLVVQNTIVPCDPEEVDYLTSLGVTKLCITSPRYIVDKTIHALEYITTRLTFRLANDIMIVREGWEDILLKQFNEEKGLQIIGELQNGVSYPENQEKLQKDWGFIKKEYPEKTTAAEYLHGSRLFAQTSVWNAYYSRVPRYTNHDHDEIFFTQLARSDGAIFKNFRGINLYLAHVGITNKDFTDGYIDEHINGRRRELELAKDKHEFTIIRP